METLSVHQKIFRGSIVEWPAKNGVFLPYQKNEFVTTEAMHCGGHLDSYHINVRKRLEDLIDKAEDLGYSNILIQKLICNELQTIRKELLSGFLKIHN